MSDKISDKLKEKIIKFKSDGDIPLGFVEDITAAFKSAGFTKPDVKKIFLIVGYALNGEEIDKQSADLVLSIFDMF